MIFSKKPKKQTPPKISKVKIKTKVKLKDENKIKITKMNIKIQSYK